MQKSASYSDKASSSGYWIVFLEESTFSPICGFPTNTRIRRSQRVKRKYGAKRGTTAKPREREEARPWTGEICLQNHQPKCSRIYHIKEVTFNSFPFRHYAHSKTQRFLRLDIKSHLPKARNLPTIEGIMEFRSNFFIYQTVQKRNSYPFSLRCITTLTREQGKSIWIAN